MRGPPRPSYVGRTGGVRRLNRSATSSPAASATPNWRRTSPRNGADRQVQPGPASPRPNVQKPLTGPQVQGFGEVVGLSDRRVAVGSPDPADHDAFDLLGDVVGLVAVSGGEALFRLAFFTRDHACSGVPGGGSRTYAPPRSRPMQR